MEGLITQIPTTLAGLFGLGLFAVSGVIWLVNRTKSGELQILKETNKTLIEAHDINSQKITQLIADVGCLTDKVLKLETEKKSLQDLVNEILKKP